MLQYFFSITLLLNIYSLSFAAAPKEIPQDLFNDFTMDGKIPVHSWYFDDSISASQTKVYSYQYIEELKAKALQRQEHFFGLTDSLLYSAIEQHVGSFKGKTVGVIGSTTPWYAAIVLAYGGKAVTIDYNHMISRHPDVTMLTSKEHETDPMQFDFLLCISSVEHEGLGRYGDPLSPNGDLQVMKKAKHMLKEGGLLFLALPVGQDRIDWNAHRIYGNVRLSLLFEGWRVISTFGFLPEDLWGKFKHPIFVLRPY